MSILAIIIGVFFLAYMLTCWSLYSVSMQMLFNLMIRRFAMPVPALRYFVHNPSFYLIDSMRLY